ncbi:MAG: hypothetical protein M0Z71_08440 [Nitrospiraceae bacterium]|nr:hypothetical protein [Nitrospiraceae bacterium]
MSPPQESSRLVEDLYVILISIKHIEEAGLFVKGDVGRLAPIAKS